MDTKNGILFCCRFEEASNPLDAMAHLKTNKWLYWSVGYPIRKDRLLLLPIIGLMHMTKDRVRYKCIIKEVKVYEPSDHLDSSKKPESWIRKQKENPRIYKSTMIFEQIEPFDYDTRELKGLNGQRIKNPPRGYQKIILP